MRGKRKPLPLQRAAGRITPADAGKTGGKDRSGISNGDHPRGCGENEEGFCAAVTDRGSPPRMRGKRRGGGELSGGDGITPADAGKTELGVSQAGHGEDHPRGCGENPRKLYDCWRI